MAARWGQGVGIKGGVVAATMGRLATSQLLSWRAWVRRASAFNPQVGLPIELIPISTYAFAVGRPTFPQDFAHGWGAAQQNGQHTNQ